MSDAHQQAHDEVVTQLIASGYLSPRPRMMGVRAWSMLLPSIAQVVGLCCFGVVAWSFTEFSGLPQVYRINLVVGGSFAIALGGSVGSLPVTVECFRKKLSSWSDWATLVFSGIASLVETVMALSFLGGFDIAQSMPRVVLLALLATLDTCLGMGQLGAYMASHDERMAKWQTDYEQAVKRYYGQPMPAPTYEAPTGEDAYTPPLPLEAPVSVNGDSGYCWCGQYCKNSQAYSAHQRAHMREAARAPDGAPYTTSVQAREAMRERYEDTIDGAREGWEFPDLATVNGWREKVLG